jgi:hypothetical protein
MLPGVSGSRPMPRKIAGNEISTMEESSDAMNMPSVVLDSAVHLYRGDTSAECLGAMAVSMSA